MKDIRITYSLLSVLCALLLPSCTQEDMPGDDSAEEDSVIVFTTSLPGVSSRTNDNAGEGMLESGFYVTAFCQEDYESASNNARIDEYFSEKLVIFTDGMVNGFRSEECRWPKNTGSKTGKLKIYAFYPSREVMRERAGLTDSESFKLVNSSTVTYTRPEDPREYNYSYALQNFTVSKDISRHVDFVIATADASKDKNLYSGVNLQFNHMLGRIELKAWGNSTKYDIEIAGLRLAGVALKGSINFSGSWSGVTDKSSVEYIFREGDIVIPICSGKHNTAGTATSIMGKGGMAMLLPGSSITTTAWDPKNYPANTPNGCYISVLLRVKDKTGKLLYPYIEVSDLSSTVDQMDDICFSVDSTTGNILKRLYMKDNKFFTDPDFSDPYTIPQTAEVRNYGWAAVPFPINPSQGTHYTYVLDYTDGVGLEEPDGTSGGKPIISPITVNVTQTSEFWPSVMDYIETDTVDVSEDIIIE